MGGSAFPEIRLVGLEKRFGDVRAVDGVDLQIGSGEFFSLLGPSGCGKTTTLRMIGGFEAPTGGRIELRGRDVTGDPPEKRPVNMVFQNYALFPHLDVAANIGFGLRRKGAPRDEIARRVAESLDLVHLPGYERRRPHELSGGQQQRVALARALVNRPHVLLLDEPLGALDLKLRRRLQVELKRIQADVGITFVYVTHDQEEALTMSDRIAVMHAGRVEQVGTPEELYERPATRFVADFVGTTNLLDGVVVSLDGTCALVRLASGEHCAVETDRADVRPGGPIALSLRPAAVALDAPPAAAPHSIPARVEQVAYLGDSVRYLVRTQGDLVLIASAPAAAPRHPVGTAVEVAFEPRDAYVLAADGPPTGPRGEEPGQEEASA